MDSKQITALIIFVITYLGIIFNKLPFLNANRKVVAFLGSVLMVVCGVISFDQAVLSIDFNTIALLLGMMIIISSLKQDGFFTLISYTAFTYAKNASNLLLLIVFITGFASAFLVNDAVVLLFTPVIVQVCKKCALNPIPFLLAEIFASNAGSLMTITGNPQNMLIGMTSNIAYGKFMLYMFPVAFASMLIIVYVIKMVYRDIFSSDQRLQAEHPSNRMIESRENIPTAKDIRTTLIIFCFVIFGFFFGKLLHFSIPMTALSGAVLTLVFSRHQSKDILKDVDWSLLLFFSSLFIIVESIKQSGVLDMIFNISLQPNALSIVFIFLLSLIFSQILSNVPYTILVLPIFTLANSHLLWIALASSSTLAGNLTIIGAMANLIVIEQAEKEGVHLTVRKFWRPALLITATTCLIACLFLLLFVVK